jgi:site-specific recombinase XerC
MQKTALRFTKHEASLGVAQLERYAEGWLLDGEIRQHSQRTLGNRQIILSKLVWFLRYKEYNECGIAELRQFLAYLSKGHLEPGGRFGNPYLTKPVTARTVKDYHGHLRTFFRWLVEEGAIEACPVDAIAAPISRPDQIQKEPASAPRRGHRHVPA